MADFANTGGSYLDQKCWHFKKDLSFFSQTNAGHKLL